MNDRKTCYLSKIDFDFFGGLVEKLGKIMFKGFHIIKKAQGKNMLDILACIKIIRIMEIFKQMLIFKKLLKKAFNFIINF